MTTQDRFNISRLKVPLLLTAAFWVIAVVLWRTTGNIFYLYNFGYIGTALGTGIGVYAALPRRWKLWGRRVAQFLVGSYMLVFLGVFQHENMQLEGLFFYVLSGFFAGSVIHYLVAKIAGPLLFNRGWCGWACWTAMVLDLLPYRRNERGRLPSRWGHLRYLHFGLSLGLVSALWWGLGYRVEEQGATELYWLLGGNALYYLVGIGLALRLQDNRAFCKYVCPIPTLQKLTSRPGLLKIAGAGEACTDCGVCTRVCPMDIRVADYIKSGRRVLSTECILCLECVDACPNGVLDVSFALDLGRRDLPREINSQGRN